MRPHTFRCLAAAGALGLSLCAVPLAAQPPLQDLDKQRADLEKQLQDVKDKQAQQQLKQQNEELKKQNEELKKQNAQPRAAIKPSFGHFYAIVLNLNDPPTIISLKRLRLIKDENGQDKEDYTFINGAIHIKQDTPIIFIVRGINPFRNNVKLTASPQERFLSSQGLFVNNLIKISQDTFKDTNTTRTLTDEIQQIKATQLSALPAVPDAQDVLSKTDEVKALYAAARRLLTAARMDERLLKQSEASDPKSIKPLQLDAVLEVDSALALINDVPQPLSVPVKPPLHVTYKDGKTNVLPLSPNQSLKPDEVDTSAATNGITNLGDYLQADLDRAYQALKSDKTKSQTPEGEAAIALYNQIQGKRADIRAKFANAAKLVSLILRASDQVAFGPFVQYGDTLRFSVEVTRTSDNETIYKDNAIYIQASHGIKINFSPGLAFSGLLDQSFTVATINPNTGQGYTLPNSTTPAVILRRDAQDQFSTAFAGFMHVYPQYPEWFMQPALTMGVGFRTANTTPTYLFGGSLFFGRDRRIILTGGIAYGSVIRLKGLSPDQLIATSLLDQVAPVNANGRTLPTSTIYRSSWFVGLSYNF